MVHAQGGERSLVEESQERSVLRPVTCKIFVNDLEKRVNHVMTHFLESLSYLG